MMLGLACAFQLCDEVLSETPTDEHVLQTLALVLRQARRIKEITAAYVAASAAAPKDQGLLLGAFWGHVRHACGTASQASAVAFCSGCQHACLPQPCVHISAVHVRSG
jgi:hypothetical protein